jgi:predicted dehydrogenase
VEWPASVVSRSTDPDALDLALRTGPYGRCVYHCDNDVPDHQATIIRFANGAVATLTVSAFAAENTRIVTVRGTRGEMRGHLASGRLEIVGYPALGFRSERRRVVEVEPDAGHDAGDWIMVERFVEHARALRAGAATPSPDFEEVIHGHAIAFAAEEARLGASVMRVGPDGPVA